MIDFRTMRRTGPLKVYLGGLLATMVISGVAGAIAAVALDAGWVGAAITVAVGVVSLAGVTLICLAWWRGIDEAAREAHKWAWWWGGTAGTVVGGLGLAGLKVAAGPLGVLPGVLAGLRSIDAISLAVAAILLCQVGGYGVAWAIWWLARR